MNIRQATENDQSVLLQAGAVPPPKPVSRDLILGFEQILLGMPQVEVRIEHEFAHGVYARTMYLKAGTTLVGKLHKTRHLFFVMSGLVLVTTEAGCAEYEGPVMVASNPGDKRVIHAVTDVVWTNIHATNETDPKRIEAEVIAPDYEALDCSATGVT